MASPHPRAAARTATATASAPATASGPAVGSTPAGQPGDAAAEDIRRLTDTATRLRRTLGHPPSGQPGHAHLSGLSDRPGHATLSMAQAELLEALEECAPTRIGDLADRLRLATNTVSGLVGQLLSAGLLTRDTDPHDRRVGVVAPTDDGRARLAGWRQDNDRRIRAALGRLEPQERAAVLHALPALVRLVDQLQDDTHRP